MDLKQIIATVVGVILGIVGSLAGIDFSKSCPPAPVAVSTPVAK